MRTAILGFALGVWLLQLQVDLPCRNGLLLCALAGVALGWLSRHPGLSQRPALTRWLRGVVLVLAAALIGFAWAGWRANAVLAEALPMVWERKDVEVVGVISGLPRDSGDVRRFVFDVEQSDAPVPSRIQLSWYPPRRGNARAPNLMPGERWHLTVRLRRPHGSANPHGFDYEAWLLERGIRATGYIREQGRNELLDRFVPGLMNTVHVLRAQVRERYLATLDAAPYAGILVALAVGDQNAIASEHWEVFRRTGVAHLVSISGLHVSLVALMFGSLVAFGWRRVPSLCMSMPARKAGALAGLLAATGYALMAGLGLPTQRALLMLCVVVLAMLASREAKGSRVLALALFVVLLADPRAVLSSGFWLSFGAVATILLVLAGRLRSPSGWRAAVRIQLAITLATVPPLIALFNGFSLVSPLANAWAVPLVSFAIAPAALIALLVPFSPLLELGHALVSVMMSGLDYLAGLPWAMWQRPALPPPLIGLALLSVVLLLLPHGTPARLAALLLLLPALLWAPARPQPGEFRLVMLDVGQGMAVHVQTADHDLLYDTGPSYGPTADAGSRVVVPYLVASGIRRLDALVISHGDSDHAGGAESVMSAMPIERLILSPGESHRSSVTMTDYCLDGDAWEWDGVGFEFVHPADGSQHPRSNDHSCVLRVSGVSGVALLTGDIEAEAERALVVRRPDALLADVVTAPHHGSRTSSSPEFVAAVGASHVLHSVGSLNPFRHPHPAVWARWSSAGARNWRTDGQGAIIVNAASHGLSLSAQRERHRRYWHGR